MADMTPPTVTPREDEDVRQLKQVTVREDSEIETVNQFMADGWRLVTVGHRADAMVYVLGRSADRRQKGRAGFLPAV
jgi:hypothetical protein